MSTCRPVTVPPGRAPLAAPPLPVARARWALFLDVDGTLLEFADDPQAVSAGPSLVALLHALHRALDGALALVSGRTLRELDRLFGHPPWAMAGLHGSALRRVDGTRRSAVVDAVQLSHMRGVVLALAAGLAGVEVEDKGVAIALHCRRAPEQLAALRAAAHGLSTQLPGFAVQPGRLVVEFKPVGMDKGRAVIELLHSPPFAGRQPVYVGDDLTDEHAFASVNAAGGCSVRVGTREPTLARCSLSDPAAVEAWLRRVLAVLGPGASAGD